jgi:hypothetical protein
MNPTYEVSGAGSEHVHKRQRQSRTLQLSILHPEIQSHDVAKSSSLVFFDSRLKRDPQELLHKISCVI